MNPQFEFLTAAGLSLVGTALFGVFARRLGAVAHPRDDRWHSGRSVPRMSGPALLLAMMPFLEGPVVVLLAAFCGVGVWDDLQPMTPAKKAIALAIPCVAVGFATGSVQLAAACWITANALNMLDHADGIAASVAGCSLFVAGGVVGVIGAGVCLGFLLLNWPPARVFLGDGGTLMLGALLAFAWVDHGPIALLAGIGIPLIEAAFVVVRRVWNRRPPWQGGTDHTGHALLSAGLPPMLLPILYGLCATLLALLGEPYA